jgi:hypothetical protein
MPEKKRSKALHRVVTEDLESDGFERRESEKLIEQGKHYIPYVRELDDNKTLTVYVGKRAEKYVLVTFKSVGMPEEINEDDDWENWKTTNREIFLHGDDLSINQAIFGGSAGPAPARLPEQARVPRPAKKAKLVSPEQQGNETEDELDEAGPIAPIQQMQVAVPAPQDNALTPAVVKTMLATVSDLAAVVSELATEVTEFIKKSSAPRPGPAPRAIMRVRFADPQPAVPLALPVLAPPPAPLADPNVVDLVDSD